MDLLVASWFFVSPFNSVHLIFDWTWRIVKVEHMCWSFVEDRPVVSTTAVLLFPLSVYFELFARAVCNILRPHMVSRCKMHMFLLGCEVIVLRLCSEILVAVEDPLPPLLDILITDLLSQIVLDFVFVDQLSSVDYNWSWCLIHYLHSPLWSKSLHVFFERRLFGRWWLVWLLRTGMEIRSRTPYGFIQLLSDFFNFISVCSSRWAVFQAVIQLLRRVSHTVLKLLLCNLRNQFLF